MNMAKESHTVANSYNAVTGGDGDDDDHNHNGKKALDGNALNNNDHAKLIDKSLATLELQYFKAVSLYRRRNYEKCVEVCKVILQTGQENNVQMFTTPPHINDADEQKVNQIKLKRTAPAERDRSEDVPNNSMSTKQNHHFYNGSNRFSSNLQHVAFRQKYHNSKKQEQHRRLPTHSNNGCDNSVAAASASCVALPKWMMEGVWQLKMRALTQRIFVDDLESNVINNVVNEDVELERLATRARPGSSIKAAFALRLGTSRSSTVELNSARTLTSSISIRPTSGITRPTTGEVTRPTSAIGARPGGLRGSAATVRATSAAVFTVSDPTAVLYQASRLNPTIYAERKVLVKSLFQFLYYHEADVQKAHSLCMSVMDAFKQKRGHSLSLCLSSYCDEWWWQQQCGRCLLSLWYPRKAETYLQQSLFQFPHPDTYLLLSRLYQRLQLPERALDLLQTAIDRHPFDVCFRLECGRLLDVLNKVEESVQMFRLITRLNPINVEALACIALNYFYDNNPEMALMYYRRILCLGFYSAELYCNMGLCCLYGGQIDLVLPCFQRALTAAQSTDQKADIWYNLSFVAITHGDFNLAKRCLQLCLTYDAQNGTALNNLAVLMAHAGNVLKAKAYVNAAKEVLPTSEEIENNYKFIESHYKL